MAESDRKIAVVAFGGNAVDPTGNSTAEEMWEHVRRACRCVMVLLEEDYRVVLTHGNGPQIGRLLIRMDQTRKTLPPMPMDVCVADTQAAIGYMIQQSLLNMTRRAGREHPIATIVTQVEVDPADPAFQNPTKPIGPFYDPSEAKTIGGVHGWKLVPDANRGYRRVVPSPHPMKIIELPVIRRLVNAGTIVITVGGGGIPVVLKDEDYAGVDAVIDKDLASAMLARDLNAYTFIILTAVEQVCLDFAKPTQRPLARITTDEARAHLADGQFPAGSMGPKIEAALEFLEGNSGEVLITSLKSLPKAIRGETGTRVVCG